MISQLYDEVSLVVDHSFKNFITIIVKATIIIIFIVIVSKVTIEKDIKDLLYLTVREEKLIIINFIVHFNQSLL